MRPLSFRSLALVLACVALAPALFAAGAKHDQEGGAGVLKFLPNVLFYEYVAFGIILLILGVYIFPKLYRQLDDRQKGIRDALDKADEVRLQAETLLRKHEEMMRRAQEDAKKITDDALAAGKQAAERITQAAQQGAEELKARASREIELMSQKAQAELRDRAVELALLASGQVLQKSLTSEDHRKLARQAIDAVGTMN